MDVALIVVCPLTRLGNRAWDARFLKGEGTVSVIEAEFKRHGGGADMDACTLDLSMFIKHIFNPVYCKRFVSSNPVCFFFKIKIFC
jgi:hypothetical protein